MQRIPHGKPHFQTSLQHPKTQFQNFDHLTNQPTKPLYDMMDSKFAGGTSSNNSMSETTTDHHHLPLRGPHHRRAQSETFFRYPVEEEDDILLDDVVADFNFASLDLPSLSSDPEPPSQSESSEVNAGQSKKKRQVGYGSTHQHLRSLSVGSDFFDEFSPVESDKDGFRAHKRGGSVDETTSFDGTGIGDSVLMMVDNSKKALGPDKLAELSLIDPKRAKRILANRQSAARSKERKTRYTSELEKKVHTLQNEATTLSAEVTKLQRDTTGLTSENKELKLRLEALEQHAHLRDALNEALKEEVNRLKIEAGQLPLHNGMNYNAPLPPQYSSHRQQLHHFANPNAQMPNSNAKGGLKPSFMDFN
uniref:transcription factor VIP1-like n=1 Tax=Erigeron canadensis TaxID=72917 RepID=UPI001CB9AC30|nr:transcription factor VIP1-like [Erigeron canadensis]